MGDDMLLLPGVWFDMENRAIAYCPACGLKAAKKAMTAENVEIWFKAVDFGVAMMGFQVDTGSRENIGKMFMELWTEGSQKAHGYPWEIKP